MHHSRKWLILSIILTLLIALPLFLLASKNQQEVRSHASSAGNTTFSCSGGYNDYVNCLSSEFDVNFSFDVCGTETQPSAYPGPSLSSEEKDSISKAIYDAFSIPLSYDNYRKEFTTTPVTICAGKASDAQGYGPSGALARVPKIGRIVLYPRFFTSHVSDRYRKYLIIHESAHVFANSARGNGIQNDLYHLISPGSSARSLMPPSLDKDCFVTDPGRKYVMKTYAKDEVGNGNQESFAEAVVNTLYCQNSGDCNPGQGQKIVNFPMTCPNTFNFIKTHVLGSDESGVVPTISPDLSPEPTNQETENFQTPTGITNSNFDINGDGKVDLLDWNILTACSIFSAIRNEKICPTGSIQQKASDLDGNGSVDQDDITLWIKQFKTTSVSTK